MSAGDGGKRDARRARPLYARVLRLHMPLGGVACFFFFEGMITIAVLLSLAEIVTWWSVVVLPLTVAAVIKVNDMVFSRVIALRRLRARGVARIDEVWSDMPTVSARVSAFQRREDSTPSKQR